MRRYVPLLIAGSALIAAACRDTVAPTRPATVVDLGGGPASFASLVSADEGQNAQVITFTINPEGGSATIGQFKLAYEANSVCNPATSGYGAEYWRAACQTLDTPITVTARFWYSDGHARSDFSPDIRFNPDRNVTISVKRNEVVGAQMSWSTYMKYNIWYFKTIEGTRWSIDEAWFDSALKTHFDTETGIVSRRVRHFSGYYVRSGCEEGAECPQEMP